MKKYLIFVVVFILAASSAFAGGKQLKSFEEVMDALKAGIELKVVIHYNKCQLISENEIQDKVPEAIGGMAIKTWEYFAEGAIRNKVAFVVTSTNHLIQNPMGEGYVNNYVKLKILADENVKITARYLSPIDYSVEMDENFFGEINDGTNEGAVYFYEIK